MVGQLVGPETRDRVDVPEFDARLHAAVVDREVQRRPGRLPADGEPLDGRGAARQDPERVPRERQRDVVEHPARHWIRKHRRHAEAVQLRPVGGPPAHQPYALPLCVRQVRAERDRWPKPRVEPPAITGQREVTQDVDLGAERRRREAQDRALAVMERDPFVLRVRGQVRRRSLRTADDPQAEESARLDTAAAERPLIGAKLREDQHALRSLVRNRQLCPPPAQRHRPEHERVVAGGGLAQIQPIHAPDRRGRGDRAADPRVQRARQIRVLAAPRQRQEHDPGDAGREHPGHGTHAASSSAGSSSPV